MGNGCSEMREKEGKEGGEILGEDGREMKEIWKTRERIEKKRKRDRNFRVRVLRYITGKVVYN
jgi:hypothetical protein